MRNKNVRIKLAFTTAFLCLLVLTTFIVTPTKVNAQTIIFEGQSQPTIPVGQYIAFYLIPVSPPIAPPNGGRISGNLTYNESWDVEGKVSGGPINIYVLNESNFLAYNTSQSYSAFEQLLGVTGSFNISVIFPRNGPNGTYSEAEGNNNYMWWMVFENPVGSTQATLYIDRNNNTASTTIPNGLYGTLSLFPAPPPVAGSFTPGDYSFYNVSWNINGSVEGGPINIEVLNDSNYLAFSNIQNYSSLQQQTNVSGPFTLSVVLPSNGPDGTYIFPLYNATNFWWTVFDNTAGSFTVTVYIYAQENPGTYRFVTSGWFIAMSAALGVGITVVTVICAVLWEKRRKISLGAGEDDTR